MGKKVPRKTGMLVYLPVTSRPFISVQKEAVLAPCIFATTLLTACILKFSEELKKAVAVSEEKIQQRSRRSGQFSGSRFPCRKVLKPWQG